MKTETIEAIEKLRELKPNWNSYGAEAVKPKSIELALKYLEGFHDNFPKPNVAASPSGNVILTWNRKEDTGELSVEFHASGEREYSLLSNYEGENHYDETCLHFAVIGWK